MDFPVDLDDRRTVDRDKEGQGTDERIFENGKPSRYVCLLTTRPSTTASASASGWRQLQARAGEHMNSKANRTKSALMSIKRYVPIYQTQVPRLIA